MPARDPLPCTPMGVHQPPCRVDHTAKVGGPPASPRPCPGAALALGRSPRRARGLGLAPIKAAPPRGRELIGAGPQTAAKAKSETQMAPEARAPGGVPCAATQRQRHRARSQVLPALMTRAHCVQWRGDASSQKTPPRARCVPKGTAAPEAPPPSCVCSRGSRVQDSEEKAPLGEEHPRPSRDLGWMLS